MKKKILGISGSMKRQNSSSEYLLSVALEAVRQQDPKIETEQVRLNDYNIIPCEGCGNCMNSTACHLLDHPEDQLEDLYWKLVDADGFIFSSPVYALSLPAQWKTWIDRCEPCSPKDLDYPYYNYDRVVNVKGKALRGKVAGMICVAAGPGHEWALASLLPPFTAVKLSMIASAGISLIEFDGQPGIQKRPWSQSVKDAEFAKLMAQGVGMRVASAIGYSTFDAVPMKKRQTDQTDILSMPVFDVDDQRFLVKDIATKKSVNSASGDSENGKNIFIIGNQMARETCREIYKQLETDLAGKCNCYVIAVIGTTPEFITRTFIKEKLQQVMGDANILFDWDDNVNDITGKKVDKPMVLICSSSGEQLKMLNTIDVNDVPEIAQFITG
jgi:multimeric flavodoxin WrbA